MNYKSHKGFATGSRRRQGRDAPMCSFRAACTADRMRMWGSGCGAEGSGPGGALKGWANNAQHVGHFKALRGWLFR